MVFKAIVLAFVLFEVAVSTPLGPSTTGLVSEKFSAHSNNHLFGIYGSHNITINKARYVGAILDTDSYLLGTAIILNNRWIATAAYNFFQLTPADVQVRVGSSYIDKQGQLLKVQKIFRPSKYEGYWDYDVALAKLSSPLKFSGTVGSTSVSNSKLPKNGAVGVVSGYGWTESSQGGFLQQVSLPISNYKTCKPSMPSFFSSLSFCTAKNGAGPCAYDFGSPLIYKNKVVGIFSGTYGCGSAQTPAAYADAAQYYKWIESTIKKNTEEGEELEYDEDVVDENDEE